MSKYGVFNKDGVQVITDTFDDEGTAAGMITAAKKEGDWVVKPVGEAAPLPTPSDNPAVVVMPTGTSVPPMETAKIEVVDLPIPPALKELFPFGPDADLPPADPATLRLPPTNAPALPWTQPLKVALLHSGGVGSTAMLLHLLARGCEVHPFFVRCYKKQAMNDYAQAMAEKSVRRLRDWGNKVKRLTVLDIEKRDRIENMEAAPVEALLTALEAEAVGENFNAIALGLFTHIRDESDSEPDADEDSCGYNERMIQVYTWHEATETATMEELLTAISESEVATFRQQLWDSTTSCLDHGEDSPVDCGECAGCVARAEAFINVWSEDRTKYEKKTAARKSARKSRLGEGQEVALAASVLPAGVDPSVARQFPMLITKVRKDGLYEVGLLRSGKLAAVGAFDRTSLESK
jgi:7-cyano-7-deazaguanine synthase in queuosine biosynthesis